MSTLLEMRDITKSFYGVKVLHQVNFELKAGEVMALCGENGAGKSTLMKILAAVYTSGGGTITVDGKVVEKASPLEMMHLGVSMIHQELNLVEEMTVAQNIFLYREPKNKLGFIDFQKMNADAKALMESLGEEIEPTTKVGRLKIAQKQMVEIAKAISLDVKIIIMDEPTAVLTQKETEILFALVKKLAAKGTGIVYISHRLAEVKLICDRVTILRDGYLVAVKEVSEVTEENIASLMVGRDIEHQVAEDFKGDPDDIVLEAKNITGEILKDVSFKVAKGEILGFSGLIGAGRSELMEMIFGLRKYDSGEVFIKGKPANFKNAKQAIASNCGFVTEDRKQTGLVIDRSIGENIDYVYRIKNRGSIITPKSIQGRAAEKIKQLRVVCQSPNQLVKNLSGGNQQKVVLSKWLSVDPEILIVDEPTRGIDVGARREIYDILEGLAKQGKTIVVVSSDLTEVLSFCQRIIVMFEGRITGVLTGEDRTEDNVIQYATNTRQEGILNGGE